MSEMSAPGNAEANAISRMRRSWLRRGSRGCRAFMERDTPPPAVRGPRLGAADNSVLRGSGMASSGQREANGRLQAVSLQPSVQRAAAQAQGLCGLTDVPVVAGHRLLDQEAL